MKKHPLITPLTDIRVGTGKTFVWPLLVILLTLITSAFIFKLYMIYPNRFMYAFGGDPLVIYYDMLYHTAFGTDAMLRGMNYPHGEYVFLTDMQGSFATVLQWINRHLISIQDVIPGIIHGLNIYLLPLCSLMVYYILDYFQVRRDISVLFAVLITFLSPAMLRFGNHFGLAYPFVIPMAILWFLRKYRHPRLEWRDLLVFATLVFFTFNNPYIGIGASGFLLSVSLITILEGGRQKERLRTAGLLGIGGILMILIPFLVFQMNDPVEDRIRQQWGFFYYSATIPGLLFPQGSLLFELLRIFGGEPKSLEFEKMINIGITTTLFLLVMLVQYSWRLVNKNVHHHVDPHEREKKIMVGAGMLTFLFAATGSLLLFAQDWLEAHLGPLLMFKAAARIGWSFYFVLAIAGVIFFDRKLRTIKSKWIQSALVLLIITISALEINIYVAAQYRDKMHDNFFHPAKRKDITNLLAQHQIDADEFQAMLVLPKMMAWSDMFLSEINWSAQFYSMRISAATGLPMINSMLSRMSTRHITEGIQMIAHPLILKELLSRLPSDKDLLLLVGAGTSPLTTGEQYLIDVSTPLFQSADFSLYRLPLDTLLRHEVIGKARIMYEKGDTSSSHYIHRSYDDSLYTNPFYGAGALLVPAGENIVLDVLIPDVPDTQFVFCAWTQLNPERPGFSDWFIRVSDTTGLAIATHQIETRRENDIQDMWVRNDIAFPAAKGYRIEAIFRNNRDVMVDELMVYPSDSSIIIDNAADPDFLFNGYKIEKQKPSGKK